jgi:hypothetical protein
MLIVLQRKHKFEASQPPTVAVRVGAPNCKKQQPTSHSQRTSAPTALGLRGTIPIVLE